MYIYTCDVIVILDHLLLYLLNVGSQFFLNSDTKNEKWSFFVRVKP